MPEGWLTPDNAPSGGKIMKLYIPEGEEWETIVRGAIVSLFLSENFEQFGSLTPEETAQYFIDYALDTMAWEECT
jgi:hypothetical protein